MNDNPAPPNSLSNLQDGGNHYTPPSVSHNNDDPMQSSLQIDLVIPTVPQKDPGASVSVMNDYQSTVNDSYHMAGQEEEKRSCEKCIKCCKCFVKYVFCGAFILCICLLALGDENNDCCKDSKKKKNEYDWTIYDGWMIKNCLYIHYLRYFRIYEKRFIFFGKNEFFWSILLIHVECFFWKVILEIFYYFQQSFSRISSYIRTLNITWAI